MCWCGRVIRMRRKCGCGMPCSCTWTFRASMSICRRASGFFAEILTGTQFGLARDDYDRLIHTTDSVIHCAASLNRKSEKSCLNVNLRGTLEVLQLGMRVHHYHGLRRFSHVSTVAVAGKRKR